MEIVDLLRSQSHGGSRSGLAQLLGVEPGEVLDLSINLNPAFHFPKTLLVTHAEMTGVYPDPSEATSRFASLLEVDQDMVLITSGASEAISLVAREFPIGWFGSPEFSLYGEHLVDGVDGPLWWASNPNNPTGRMLALDELPDVVDEAYYQMATGEWSRRDFERGAISIFSFTKLFSMPGLRLGCVVADPTIIKRLGRLQPLWSVSSLALAVLIDLINDADLGHWSALNRQLRNTLVDAFLVQGLSVSRSDANFIWIEDGIAIGVQLAEMGILVRSGRSFGYPSAIRVAVPNEHFIERVVGSIGRLS